MKSQRVNVQLLQLIILFLGIIFLVIILANKPSILGFVIFTSQPSPTQGYDTYIRQNSTTSFNNSVTLKIGRTAAGQNLNALLKFNVSSISSSDTVTTGILEVYMGITAIQNSTTIRAYRLTNNWNRETVTWDERDSGLPWFTSGGDYNPTPIDSVVFTNQTKWYNFTISETARGWVNGTYPNYGIILVAVNPSDGDVKEIYSADYTDDANLRPILFIDHSPSAAPTITNISTNSYLPNPKNVGQSINISVYWSDLDSSQSQIFVCNSTSISVSGCAGYTYCNSSIGSSNPLSCLYTVAETAARNTTFWAAACDLANCSSANQSYFNMNHIPVISIIQPNGGEVINQSATGNYTIQFTFSDKDADKAMANIYYGETPNSTTFTVKTNLNLTTACSDPDTNTTTTNACTYSWDTSGIFGNYYLTILANDSYGIGNDTSDNTFNVKSLVDNVNPDITAQWITDNRIYSGKVFTIYANASDLNLQSVWVSINTSPQQNLTMSNSTNSIVFSANVTAGAIGNYTYKIYANDTVGNVNDSSSLQTFQVFKPDAVQRIVQTTANSLPYHVVQVIAELNASDPLRNVYAYLHVPSGFTFLSDYPQNFGPENYSANETRRATWFVSTPLNESNYTLNVTYNDNYLNNWTGNNSYINVNSNIGTGSGADIYTVSVEGYPEVETTDQYYVESYFKKNGAAFAADSVTILIYDSLGSLIVGPASMSNTATGTYNYSYTIGASVAEGIWQTIINATRSGTSYYTNHFWKVVGGPFDVRDIVVNRDVANDLNITVTTENTGGAIKDLVLSWELTRVDNEQLLDSGQDTFAVNPSSTRNWTVYPKTNYVGQVKIAFVGMFSGTEKAGAYKIFSTTSPNGGGDTGGSGGGGGGRSGGGGGGTYTPEQTSNEASATIIADKNIYLTKNIPKRVGLKVTNIGKVKLHNLVLEIIGIPSDYYIISPTKVSSLSVGDEASFEIIYSISDLVGENDIVYKISSDELNISQDAILNVLSTKEFFLQELERLRDRIQEIKDSTDDKNILDNLDVCSAKLPGIEGSIEEEQFLEAKDKIKSADDCLDKVQDQIGRFKFHLPDFVSMENLGQIITWVLLALIVLALFIILYVMYRKMGIVSFLKAEEGNQKPESGSFKKEIFEDKLKEIERKLDEE